MIAADLSDHWGDRIFQISTFLKNPLKIICLYQIYREFDDKKSCWHGPVTFEDCNNASLERNLKLRYFGGNCKWWHFTPEERYPALKSKFDEIMNGEAEKSISKYLIDSVRSYIPPAELIKKSRLMFGNVL